MTVGQVAFVQRMKISSWLCLLSLCGPATVRTASADDGPVADQAQELHPIFVHPIRLRLHGGVGAAQRAKTGDGFSLAVLGGAQLMLPANKNQGYGIEVSYIQTDARNARRYVATGLFVENRLFGWFLMSLGFGAYVPLQEPRPIPVGISTKLGWNPDLHPVINPFVVFRADWIFDDRFQGVLSADGGLEFKF